ncbi:Mu transposase C-terminal domain-containing protein, partial [Pseudomonas sp. MAP12]
ATLASLRSDCPAGWPWNRWPDVRGMPGRISVDWVAGWRGIRTHVESLFDVLDDGLFSKMPGAKKSADERVKNRHARAEAEACYSVSEIYQQVVKFIADVYIHKPNVKLGFKHGQRMSIKLAMDEALNHFMPLPPPSLEQIRRLILDLNRAERQVQHYGVDFEGFQFHSAELAQLARERVLSRIDLLFNPEDCTAIYAVHPDDGTLIRLDNKMIGMPSVSFATAKALKAAYSASGPMTGHDYQRTYAQMLAQFAVDSQRRRPKIKANNRAMQQQEKLAQKAAFNEEIEKALPQLTVTAPIPSLSDDDDFLPAPRQEFSHER